MAIETLLTTNLLTGFAKIAGLDGASTLIRLLTDRAKEAEQKRTPCSDKNNPLESLRDNRLKQIAQLRNRAALGIRNAELQQRILCILMEQSIATYDSVNQRDLEFVSANLEHVDAAVSGYDEVLANRQKIRALAVLVSVLSLTGIGGFLYMGQHMNLLPSSTVPILGVPTAVLLWSVIGSFAAILYRFSNAGDVELEDPLRWLFSRPLTGIIMGAITYLIIKAGLLTLATGTKAELASNEIMWLIAFLAGFSDRFSDTLLRSMVGRFGGEKTADLISTQTASTPGSNMLLSALAGVAKRPSVKPAMLSDTALATTSTSSVAISSETSTLSIEHSATL